MVFIQALPPPRYRKATRVTWLDNSCNGIRFGEIRRVEEADLRPQTDSYVLNSIITRGCSDGL